MSDDMTTKYQNHYNQVLTGTLNDAIMKSISYQANIKLANEIIAEQEKTITDLKSQVEGIQKDAEDKIKSAKQELDSFKSNKLNADSVRITTLENNVKSQQETILKLNTDLVAANKLKVEFENLKNQATNGDIFRRELMKERENHAITKSEYEQKITELNEQIDVLKAPVKRKKPVRKSGVLELIGLDDNNDNIETVDSTDEIVKDGGSF